MEYELSYYKSGEKYGDKINLAKDLLKIDSLNRNVIEYICRYYDDRKIDSVSIFFDELIKKHSYNPETYIIRAELIYFDKKHNNERDKAAFLKKAIQLDSLNIEACYKLAELYYKDFIAPTEKMSWGFGIDEEPDFKIDRNRKSVFSHPADSALYYFHRLIKINPRLEEIVFAPIRQIEKYKDFNLNPKISPISEGDNCYFPSWYFANLTNGRENDMTKYYMFTMDFSFRTANGLKVFLEAMKEPCLYQNPITHGTEIFRFTWLRSFDPPIVVRIEKKENGLTIFWKKQMELEDMNHES